MPLYQPSNVSPSDLTGTGAIDVTAGMTVTWQVNGSGNVPMTGYQIVIMQNDTDSTQLYDSGRVTLQTPFYGSDNLGNPVYFSAAISAATLSSHGITNRADISYKYLITQYWGASDSVTQSSANVFVTRSAPSISISNYAATIGSISYTFTGAYSQAQGDPMEWARWRITSTDGSVTLVDTGTIYNVGPLSAGYNGFMTGQSYRVRLNGMTMNGVEFDTGWKTFAVQYASTVTEANVTACPLCNTDAVQVTANLGGIASGATLAVYRRQGSEQYMMPYANIDLNATPLAIRDYGATNGEPFTYYLFTIINGAVQRNVYSSPAVTPRFWNYTLMLCEADAEGAYHVQQEYRFALDVSTGTGSNNNRPALQANFTPYPLRQPSSQNYRSGTLTAYAGSASNGVYTDSLSEIEALRQISTSGLTKFLKTRKGELMRVETADAISMTIGDKYAQQPVRAAIPWVEVGSAENARIITTPNDQMWQGGA